MAGEFQVGNSNRKYGILKIPKVSQRNLPFEEHHSSPLLAAAAAF